MKQNRKIESFFLKVLLAFFILVPATPAIVLGQYIINENGGSYSFSPLVKTMNSGSRDLSLASATSSDISKVSESFLNPASLPFKTRASIYSNTSHSWTTNVYTLNVGVRNLKAGRSYFGLDMQYLSSGFNEINYLGRSQIFEPDINRAQLSISYAYLAAPVLSFGLVGNAYTAWNDFYTTEHLNMSIGTIYTPSDRLSYSLQVNNIGYGLGFNRLGNGVTKLVDKNIEESLEYGVSMYFPERGRRNKISIYASTETKLKVEEIYYRFAGEFNIKQTMFFRVGYLNGSQRYVGSTEESGMTFGLGFNLNRLEINYSAAPGVNFYDRVHQFGFIIKL